MAVLRVGPFRIIVSETDQGAFYHISHLSDLQKKPVTCFMEQQENINTQAHALHSFV